jgi:hypothetical protein
MSAQSRQCPLCGRRFGSQDERIGHISTEHGWRQAIALLDAARRALAQSVPEGRVPDWAGRVNPPDTPEGKALLDEIAETADRLGDARFLVLRPDVFPGLTAALGMTVVRIPARSPLEWAVLAGSES